MENNASILKQRIIVKRLNNTADGYGGFVSSSQTTIGTFWCKVQEISGNIDSKSGIRLQETVIDITIRKPTADLILIGDVFEVEGNPTQYRFNGGFQTTENFWVKIKATKIDD